MRTDGNRVGAAGPEHRDPLLALVLDRLDTPVREALLLFPPDGAPVLDLPTEHLDLVHDLLEMELVDHDGLVSFRIRLVELAPGSLRLSRLGRAVVSAIHSQR